MGGVNDRRSRPTIPFDSQTLARRAEQDAAAPEVPLEESIEDAFKEWEAEQGEDQDDESARPARTASGTRPPATRPSELRARTMTVHDPLTTSLLAEVARRAQTVDVTPAEIVEAKALDADDEVTPPPTTRPSPIVRRP